MIPSIIVITHGKVHDVNILDQLVFEPGAIYVMDRGYLDFKRLYKTLSHQPSSLLVPGATSFSNGFIYFRSTNPLACSTIRSSPLTSFYRDKGYMDKLRRIRFYDSETNRRLVFLTNNFTLSSPVIAQLYRTRWQVELFFKWIKQHLRIKAFFGTIENPVKTQMWIAICVYVLVAIAKKRLHLEGNLCRILQILSVTVFQKTLIFQAFSDVGFKKQQADSCNQMTLFD